MYSTINIKYSEQNPHPDLEYVETRDNGQTWYRCCRCNKYQNSVHRFGWQCAHCNYNDQHVDVDKIIDAIDDY